MEEQENKYQPYFQLLNQMRSMALVRHNIPLVKDIDNLLYKLKALEIADDDNEQDEKEITKMLKAKKKSLPPSVVWLNRIGILSAFATIIFNICGFFNPLMFVVSGIFLFETMIALCFAENFRLLHIIANKEGAEK